MQYATSSNYATNLTTDSFYALRLDRSVLGLRTRACQHKAQLFISIFICIFIHKHYKLKSSALALRFMFNIKQEEKHIFVVSHVVI